MNCLSRGSFYLVNSFCDLQEDDQWKRESYESCWLSLVLETRPQFRLTLSETDSVRRESYKQQQVEHFMVERSPDQVLKLGSIGGVLTEHQLPFFSSGKLLQNETVQPNLPGKENKGEEKTTAESPNLNKLVGVNYRASSLMSSPREISHRIQRRE